MIQASSNLLSDAVPTLWGLTPVQLHDRYWAARGVQVVRQGEPSEVVERAELFLLTESRTLAIFKLYRIIDALAWVKPDVVCLRLVDGRERGYCERAVTSADSRFIRFERIYRGSDARLARVALTPERRLALLWQKPSDVGAAWRAIRQEVPRSHRMVMSVNGTVYDRSSNAEVMDFVRSLVRQWPRPDATVMRAHQASSRIWADQSTQVGRGSTLIGPIWIGAGRTVAPDATIVGPRVLWDAPEARPHVESIRWEEIEPTLTSVSRVTPRRRTSFAIASKRVFDVVFAIAALLLTLPLYPFIMLAIWFEDGAPFFFVHHRESLGGREFGCIKFRSMRKDAERVREELMQDNQADGPQFFIEKDPRLTRVGRFIRAANIDELPQFWNVLLGHMSVVGPRPSPYRENQFCPAWREARLSVRPGITGLWQVRRTRRIGLDFQEWIKFDIEYVENVTWWLDLRVIWETVLLVVRGVVRS